ncbi:hypothetical protein GC089_13375 [Cellulomonas sp. JZ18]|uniref:hypothetical protein n=1 Tax=Cellulomonas sp. JZ18 TaxID=2654191 RepID=UPI0012D4414A|nr:hypothetical protein [Cellulomonas sp. JZ18]QGQ20016.1 hypothetical protein GC089_13375 [Cellulomonas sp. JZ18]
MLVLAIGAGAGLTAVVVLADVLIRRAALGRRRALGCSRSALTALVLLRSLYAVTADIVTGCAAASMAANAWGAPIPLAFTAATATLAVLATLAATMPPALAAALRDPLAVLRTP